MSVALNYEAARQLHADLMALPNFRGLMFPELFDNVSKSSSIEAAAGGTACQIAVTPGGFELANAGERAGGALVDVGVLVYVFTSSQYASGPAENEAMDALLLELAQVCCRFAYVPAGVVSRRGEVAGIPARLAGIVELDMVTEAGFTDKVAAKALSISLRINLSKP